jgi:hypothetical protein
MGEAGTGPERRYLQRVFHARLSFSRYTRA